MKDKDDILINHYRGLQLDKVARQRLIENPKEKMAEDFGIDSIPEEVKIEVIPQEHDTKTILLPSPLKDNTSDEAIDAASRRIYDILFTDRKSTRLNSSHVSISYAVFCLKKKNLITLYSQRNKP